MLKEKMCSISKKPSHPESEGAAQGGQGSPERAFGPEITVARQVNSRPWRTTQLP